jgi:hypothetical protein
LQILINTTESSLESFKRATGIEFTGFNSSTGQDSVAVVIQGSSFDRDISNAIGMGIPVVVIAGNAQECVEKAKKHFIPEPCIILKKDNSVVTAEGKKIAEAVGGGIGVRAAVKVAEYALKNKLCPEPLIWFETEPTIEPVITTNEVNTKKETKKEKKNVIPLRNPAEDIVDIAKKAVVVFKATPDADSGRAARDLSASLNGVHAELANEPRSYALYGDTVDEAVATGKYISCNGKALISSSFVETDWLVVEIDTDILASCPKLVDRIYKKADKIVHVVGDFEKGKLAIDAWRSNWKLDAIVSPGRDVSRYKNVYGNIVTTDICRLTEKMA